MAVTMGCGDECPFGVAGSREDWQITDPREMSPEEFRGVRNLIEKKVLALLSDLPPLNGTTFRERISGGDAAPVLTPAGLLALQGR